MKKTAVRVLALCAVVLLTVVLPACSSMEDGGGDVYVGVGVAVYGYYPPGWGGGCCYGPVGGAGVVPPIGMGGRPTPY